MQQQLSAIPMVDKVTKDRLRWYECIQGRSRNYIVRIVKSIRVQDKG